MKEMKTIEEMKAMKTVKPMKAMEAVKAVKAVKVWRVALAMLAAICITACNKYAKDGDWDPMVWRADVPVAKTSNGAYDVAAEGATLVFSCRNYARPWFADAAEDGEVCYPPRTDNYDYLTLSGEHFEAGMNGNKLTITFEPNTGSAERTTILTVTAGDIFHTFKFKQFAK